MCVRGSVRDAKLEEEIRVELERIRTEQEPDPTDKRKMLVYPTVSNYISQKKIDEQEQEEG